MTVVFIAFVVFQFTKFVFRGAEWEVINANRRLIAIGRFPQGEEWRVWPPFYVLLALIGLSLGLWSRVTPLSGVLVAAILAFLFGLFFEGDNALLAGGATALGIGGYLVAEYGRLSPGAEARARRAVVAGWLLLLPFTVLMLVVPTGFAPPSGVESSSTSCWRPSGSPPASPSVCCSRSGARVRTR